MIQSGHRTAAPDRNGVSGLKTAVFASHVAGSSELATFNECASQYPSAMAPSGPIVLPKEPRWVNLHRLGKMPNLRVGGSVSLGGLRVKCERELAIQ